MHSRLDKEKKGDVITAVAVAAALDMRRRETATISQIPMTSKFPKTMQMSLK